MDLAGHYAYAGRELERVRRIVGGTVTDTVHVHALGMDRVGPESCTWLLPPADATLRLLREAERELSLSKSLARMLGSERPSGSSAFRLSATPAWMSLTGSCFSSESAPGRLGAYRSSTATMTSCCVFTGAAARSPNEALFGYAQRVTTGDVPGFATKSK